MNLRYQVEEGRAIRVYRKWIIPICVTCLLIAGVALRFYGIDEHMTQIDELASIAGPYMTNQGHPRTVSMFNLFSKGAADLRVRPKPEIADFLTFTIDSTRIKTNPFIYAAYVSTVTTYAPAQFFFYPILLSGDDYSYREFLVRGRLPSAIFSSIALLFFVFMYRGWRKRLDSSGILGITIFSFSLMNITYAQQAMPYSLGVLVAAGYMLMLVRCATKPSDIRTFHWMVVVSSAAVYSNYQVLPIVPAGYLALFAIEWRFRKPGTQARLIRKYLISISLFLVMVSPLFFFIHDKLGVSRHAQFALGINQIYPQVPDGDLVEILTYLLQYYFQALYTVVDTNIGFTPAGALGRIVVHLLFVFFCLGWWGLFRWKEPGTLVLGVFVSLLIIEWFVLNAIKMYPIAHSRHVLVLTPIVVFLISVGMVKFNDIVRMPNLLSEAGVWLIVVIVATLFSVNYGQFRSDRKDLFDENILDEILKEHKLDTILGYEATWNPALMFRQRKNPVRFIDLDKIVERGELSKVKLPDAPFLLVSQFGPIEEGSALGVAQINRSNRAPSYRRADVFLQERGFKIRQLVSISSNTQMGITKEYRYAKPGFFVAIAEK